MILSFAVVIQKYNKVYMLSNDCDDFLMLASAYVRQAVTTLKARGITIITPYNQLVSSNSTIEYTCNPCSQHKIKKLKEAMDENCRACKGLKLQAVPTDEKVLEAALGSQGLQPDEVFFPIEGAWLSNQGRCVSALGKLLTLDDKGRYHVAGRHQYLTKMLEDNLKISTPTPRSIQVSEQRAIQVASTRTEAVVDPVDLVTARLRDKSVRYNTFTWLPRVIIFEDGMIYNAAICKFVATTESYEGPNKQGYLIFSANSMSGLRVHRIVCMAFNPIEGLSTLDDYKPWQVNHKDGNKHNNHASNLEWVQQSNSVLHAYTTGLNKKVRPVVQYAVNTDGSIGDVIAEHVSVAQAARTLNIPEHVVRMTCKGEMKPTKTGMFWWKFKFQEQNQEWSAKFNSSLKLVGDTTAEPKAKKARK